MSAGTHKHRTRGSSMPGGARAGHLNLVPDYDGPDAPPPGSREAHLARTIAQRSKTPVDCAPVPPGLKYILDGDSVVRRLDALDHTVTDQAAEIRAVRAEVSAQVDEHRATRAEVAALARSVGELKQMIVELRGGGNLLEEFIAKLGGPVSDEGDLDPAMMAAIFSSDDEDDAP